MLNVPYVTICLLYFLDWSAQLAMQLVVWNGSLGNLSVDTYSMGALQIALQHNT